MAAEYGRSGEERFDPEFYRWPGWRHRRLEPAREARVTESGVSPRTTQGGKRRIPPLRQCFGQPAPPR